MLAIIILVTWISIHFHCVSGFALPWIITTYYEIEVTTIITATTYTDITYTQTGLIRTNIVGVIPTVTPIPTLSVVTTTDRYESDLTIVEVLLPSGAGSTATRYPFIYPTTYYVQLFYTAPSTCSSRWVYSTTAYIGAPYEVTFAPTSVSTILFQPQAFGPTTTDFAAWVNPTDIPAPALSSLSSRHAPYFTGSCSIPYYYTATGTTPESDPTTTPYAGGSSSGSSGNNFAGCSPFLWYFAGIEMGRGYICSDGIHYTQGISLPNFVIAWICSWLGLFLIIGLIESYITFSRLACGLKARRGMPIAFACLLPLFSCFFLCCSNRGYTAKSTEDQRLLREQWERTPFFTRIGRWLQWGFRYKYPPFFGHAPARRSNWENKNAAAMTTSAPHVEAATAPYTAVIIPAGMEHPQQYSEAPSPTYYEMPTPNVSREKPNLESNPTI